MARVRVSPKLKRCECRLCERGRWIEAVLKRGTKAKLREVVLELYNALENVELDHDVLKCKLNGDWEGYSPADKLVAPNYLAC